MIKKNLVLLILLTLYTLFGVWLSINNGISHDAFHEQANWYKNLEGIKLFLTTGEYEEFLNYKDKYHGIGFHLFSQPFQFFFSGIVEEISGASSYGSLLITKHISIFVIFSISAVFFYLIALNISKNFNFSILTTAIYITYPYLFGHAQINPKDIPFLSVWLINTYFFIVILKSFLNKEKIKIRNIILLSFFSAYLISIRISGILIFIQYFMGILILNNYAKIDFKFFLIMNIKYFLYSFVTFFLFVLVLNPIFWHNPIEFFNSIKWMSKYQQDVCTLTLGNCMKSLNLPSSYFFIWFFFKLPILIIIGLFIYPIVEKKIFHLNKETIIQYLIFLLTPIIIILLFILKDIALYDEIRHIMFLIPFLFLISLFNIFIFNERLFHILAIPLLLFFIIENFSINPYQYTWMNSFAKFKKIDKNFEVDYWGISNKNLQKEIIKYTNLNSLDKNICIYGDTYVKEFLITNNFTCFKNYSELDSAKVRPFIAYQNVRNIKRNNPRDCKLIHEEKYQYSFSNQNIKVANLWFCD